MALLTAPLESAGVANILIQIPMLAKSLYPGFPHLGMVITHFFPALVAQHPHSRDAGQQKIYKRLSGWIEGAMEEEERTAATIAVANPGAGQLLVYALKALG